MTLKKILLIIYICLIKSQAFSCTCIGKSTIKNDIKNSDFVVIGQILKRTETLVWVNDTSLARNIYDSNKNNIQAKYTSYKEFKESAFRPFKEYEYTVVILKKYKGSIKADTVIIKSGIGNGDCGFKFTIGEKYLIFAIKESLEIKSNKNVEEFSNIYRTDICSRTQIFAENSDDNKYLIKNK